MISQNANLLPVERTSVYTLPKFLSEIEHITTVDTGGLEFVICCDRLKLYIFPLIAGTNKPLGNIHQSLPIPNIKSLRTIAKNYLMIETENKYIGIFEILKSIAKQSTTQKPVNPFQFNAVKVEFSEVLKWRTFSCYFIREVMENLFEVQVFFTDFEFEIFQFTIKNKRGSMSFTISQNGKIQKCNKKQLYGSKCFFNIGRKLMYWLKNFSDKQFVIQEISIQQPFGPNKLLNEPLAYFGVQRSEEYKHIYPNLVIRDCINPAKRFPLKIQKDSFLNELKAQIAQITPNKKKQHGQENPFNDLVEQSSYLDNIMQIFDSLKITTFTDLLMVENRSKKQVQIYQIKGDGSELIGKQTSQVIPSLQSKDKKPSSQGSQSSMLQLRKWQWHFGNSKKLIAIDKLGFQLKYIQDISLQKQNQQFMEAEVVNMNEKSEEVKQQVEVQKTEEKKTQVLSQNLGSEKTQQIKSAPKQEQNHEAKRKFSKDELQKFCDDFKEKDARKYVNKQLIQKVDEINNWVKKQVPTTQKQSETIGSFTIKSKSSPEPEKTKTEELTIKRQHKSQASPKQTALSNQSITDEVKKQNPVLASQQTSTNVKEKPPMKIIQRSKISVAKTFQPENGLKGNEDEKKVEVKDDNVKSQETPQENKPENDQIKKSQKQGFNPFVKFGGKGESNEQNTDEKQKKRFMKNYLSHQRKEETPHVVEKQFIDVEEVAQDKNSVPQKQEKVKFNVITRASLLKKKEVEAAQQNQNLRKKSQVIESGNNQSKLSELFQQKTQQVESIKERETKSQPLQISEEQKSPKEQKSPRTQIETEPKTKFVPSIDIGKASKNHLNDCDFLSEDSVSNDGKEKDGPKEQEANEDSIEQQIDGQPNQVLSKQNEKQTDLEYLIDDNINLERKENSQVQRKVCKEEKVPYVNPDEQIQKFCNTLLDDEEIPKYQKKQSQSSIIKEMGQNLNFQNRPDFKLENAPWVKSKVSVEKKQEEDEMAKFNSLMFKTSIKRTNIFSSEQSQNDEKMEETPQFKDSREIEFPKDDQIKELKNIETQLESKQMKNQIDTVQSQQQQVSQKPQNKKSKDWHGSSSEQEDLKEVSEVKQEITNDEKNNSLGKLTNPINEKPSQFSIQQKPSEEHESKPVQQHELSKQKESQQEKLLIKNPFIQAVGSVPQSKVESVNQNKSLFEETIKSNSDLSKYTENPRVNPFLAAMPKKTIIRLDNNVLPGANPFLFGVPPPSVIGGSNSSTLKKFLSEREHKKQEEHKREQNKIQYSLKVEVDKKPSSEVASNELKSHESKPQSIELVPPMIEQTKQISEKKPIQQFIILTSALPQIQQLISKYEQSTIQLLEEQQKTIIKSLQQIPHTHNPYNKNTSLLLPEQIKQEIIKQSKNSVKKWLSTKMLDKIEVSFREIMQEQKIVYEEALKFYQTEARKKITTMQLQYQQQSAILVDIENVSANMCAALQGSVLEGEELYTYQLKQWKRQIQEAQTNLIDPLAGKIQDTKTYFEHRNKNLQSMTDQLKEIKEILKEKLRKKQEHKELKERKKQQKQQKLKLKLEEEAKLQFLKIKEQAKKQAKKKKHIDENEGHVTFQTHSNPRFHQGQYYGRQPYPYY